jgi:hypothetical protein
MSMSTALIANVALDLAAIVPIFLLTRWAIARDREDGQAVPHFVRRAGAERGRRAVTEHGRMRVSADQPPA